jgi:site-specific DNA-methyltransferase (adenine-specific)
MTNTLHIEQVALKDIQPYDKNAKKHPRKQVEQIANSIRAFGFLVPIILDKNNELIAGHGRVLAAEELAIATVPAIRAEHLTEEQVKAYRLADNKLNESDWDMDLVIEELKELSLPMLDLTGFSRDLILDIDDMDDVVPGTPTTPKSKLGDVYILGRHTLVVGDSTKPEAYEKLLGGGQQQTWYSPTHHTTSTTKDRGRTQSVA